MLHNATNALHIEHYNFINNATTFIATFAWHYYYILLLYIYKIYYIHYIYIYILLEKRYLRTIYFFTYFLRSNIQIHVWSKSAPGARKLKYARAWDPSGISSAKSSACPLMCMQKSTIATKFETQASAPRNFTSRKMAYHPWRYQGQGGTHHH